MGMYSWVLPREPTTRVVVDDRSPTFHCSATLTQIHTELDGTQRVAPGTRILPSYVIR